MKEERKYLSEKDYNELVETRKNVKDLKKESSWTAKYEIRMLERKIVELENKVDSNKFISNF